MTMFFIADACEACLGGGLVVCAGCDEGDAACTACHGTRRVYCACAAGEQLRRRWAPLRAALAAADKAALSGFIERGLQFARREASELLLELVTWEPGPLRRHLARRQHKPTPETWRRAARALTNDAFDDRELLECGWELGEQLTCMLAVARLEAVEARPVALQRALCLALGLHAARGAIALVVGLHEVVSEVRGRARRLVESVVTSAGAANACRALAGAEVGAQVRANADAAVTIGEDAALVRLEREL